MENKEKSEKSGEKKYSPIIWPKLQLSLKERDEIFRTNNQLRNQGKIVWDVFRQASHWIRGGIEKV